MLFDFTPFSAGPDKLSVKAISGPSEVQDLRQEVHLLRADMQRMDRDRQQDRLHLQDALDSGLQQQQLELHLDLHEELAHERAHLRKEICQQLRDELCAGLRPKSAQESAQLQAPRVECRRGAWQEARARQELWPDRRGGLAEKLCYIVLQCFVIVYVVILAIWCYLASWISIQ